MKRRRRNDGVVQVPQEYKKRWYVRLVPADNGFVVAEQGSWKAAPGYLSGIDVVIQGCLLCGSIAHRNFTTRRQVDGTMIIKKSRVPVCFRARFCVQTTIYVPQYQECVTKTCSSLTNGPPHHQLFPPANSEKKMLLIVNNCCSSFPTTLQLSADPAGGEDDVSRRRPVIINADEDGGGDGQARWEPGQLSRLAQRQQRQRDEEDEEERGVARTPMLGPDAVVLIICANRFIQGGELLFVWWGGCSRACRSR